MQFVAKALHLTITLLGFLTAQVIESEVPDAFQLPIACRFLSLSQRVDVIIPVGILIQSSANEYAE